MFINSVTKAFPSRTTNTSSSFAGMSSETPCVRNWSIVPRIGGGDHCGDGNRSPSQTRSCCRRGRFHDCRNGWNGLTTRSRRWNWTQFVSPLIEAVHWEMKHGWNQSPDASTWSPQCVHEDGKKFDLNRNRQSKTPDPFDLPSVRSPGAKPGFDGSPVSNAR